MAITLTTPITIPAQSEKTADQIWILAMNVNALDGPASPVTAVFSVAPFVSSTGEVLTDQKQMIRIDDVFATAESSSILASAVTSIYAAVQDICEQKGLFGMTTGSSG